MDDKDTLARTLYGEAEANNSIEAMAIAMVVKNRMGRVRWPNTVAEVCLQPLQFSCWNGNDPNRSRILNASGTWFNQCTSIADRLVKGSLRDESRGATHYYSSSVKKPAWAVGHKPCYSIIHRDNSIHYFFNDIDTAPPVDAVQALDQVRPLADTRTMRGANMAVTATSIGMVAPAIAAITPAIPLLQTIAQYAPYVFGIITVVGIVCIILARLDDRNKGLR